MTSEEVRRAERRSGATLKQILSRPLPREPVDLEPGCAYGVVTRQRVDDLATELREIKGRLNQLFTLVIGSIVLDLLLRIAGIS